MSEQELSISFSKNYKEIINYAHSVIFDLKKKIEVDVVMSELYLHIHRFKDEINEDKTLLAYSKKWIKSNLYWSTSPINKKNKLNNIEGDVYVDTSTSNQDISYEQIQTLQKDFFETLTRYDKGLYTMYFTNKIDDIHKIKSHLNIGRTSGYETLNECRALENKLKNYIIKNIYI